MKRQTVTRCFAVLAMLTVAAATLRSAQADSGTWTSPGTGNWSGDGNWSGGIVADGSGNSANFSTIDIPSDVTVHLDTPRIIGSLLFGDLTTTTAGGWTLDDNGDGLNILTLAGGTPTITVNALYTGRAATLSLQVAGSAGFTKTGAGMLTLSGANANTYTGTTTLSGTGAYAAPSYLVLSKPANVTAIGGDVTMVNDDANVLYPTANNQFAAGCVLTMSGGAGTHARLELEGTAQTLAGVANGGSGRGVIQNRELAPANTGASTLTLDGSGTYAFNGYFRNWNGTIGLVKSGGGTQTFSGGNITYTGATTVNGGTLTLQDTTAFTSAITVGGSGTLTAVRTALGIAGRSPIMGNTVTGSGIININNAGSGIAGGWTTFSGGTSSLNFSGTLNVNSGVFARDNTNPTTINGSATVNVAAGAAFGAGRGGNSTIGALNGAGDVSTLWSSSNAGSITLGNGGGSGTFTGIIHGNGSSGTDGALEGGVLSLIKTGGGTQILAGANTYSGTTTISGGTLQLGDGASGHDGSLATGSVTDNATLAYNLFGNQTVAYAIGGSGNVTKSGPGTLTFRTSQAYTGATTISGGGLKLNSLLPAMAAGAALWLDASDTSTLFKDAGGTLPVTTSGDVIALWKDKSGNGNHATLTGSNTGPAYQAGVQMGNSVARFNGTSTTSGNGMVTPLMVTSGNLSVFVVYSFRDTGSTARRVVQGGPTTGNNWLVGPYNNRYQSYSGAFLAGPATVQNQFVLHEVIETTGGVLAQYVNGAAYGTRTGAGYPNQIGLGVAGGYPESAYGDIAELLVYTTPLSTTERQGIETYLSQKWLSGTYGTTSLAAASAVAVGAGATFGGAGSAGTVTVDAGGTVEGGQIDGGTLTLNNLAFTGTGGVQGYLGASTPIVVTGAVTANGGAASISVTPQNLPPSGTYHFLAYGGANPFSAFKFASPSRSLTLVDNSAGQFVDIAVDTSAYPIWTGALSGEWSINALAAPKNWAVNTGGQTDFYAADAVLFDDTAPGTTDVVINNGNVTPGSTTFNNATKSYTLSGANSVTAGALVKNGAGAVTLNNANAFSSATLNAGTLIAANNNAFSSAAGSLIVFAGGALQAGGAVTLPNNVVFNSNAILDGGAGGLTLAGATDFGSATRTLTVNNIVTLTSGAGGLIKAGSGTLRLAGNNTYNGATTVSVGMLEVPTGGTLNNSAAFSSSAGVGVTGGSLLLNSPVFNAGTLDITGGAFTCTAQSQFGNGAGAFVWTQSGGVTTIGGINAALNAAKGGSACTLNFSGGTINANGFWSTEGFGATSANTCTLNLSGTAVFTITAGAYGLYTGNGTSTFNLNGGTFALPAYYFNYSGNSTAAAVNWNFNGSTVRALGTVAIAANPQTTTTIGAGGAILDSNGNAISIGSPLTGTGGLTKLGTGTLTLNGTAANTYAGATTLSVGKLVLGKTAGVNAIGGALAISTAANWAGSANGLELAANEQIPDTTVVRFTGTDWCGLRPEGFTETVAGLDSVARGVIENAGSTQTGVTANGTLAVNTPSATSYSFTGYIRDNESGTTKLNLVKSGGGSQALTGVNIVYTGTTTVNGGRLILTNTTAFVSSTTLNGGTLEVALSSAWTVGTAALNITGNGTVVKRGAATWYTGASGRHVNFNLTGGLIDIQGGMIQNNYNGASFGNNQASVNIAAGAVLDLFAENAKMDALTGAGTVQDAWHTPNVTLTVGVLGGSGTFAGTISQPSAVISLVKTGAGTQALGGINTYTGATTVDNGQLLVNGTHNAPAATYSVNTGAILGGTGTVYSVVNLANNATLAPGGTNVTGRFTIQNDVTLSPGATFHVDIQGTDVGQPVNGYDQLVVGGGKTLIFGNNAAPLTIRVPQGTTLPINHTFTIYVGAYSGSQFQDKPEGAEIFAGAYSFIIHYGSGVITLDSRKVDSGTLFLMR